MLVGNPTFQNVRFIQLKYEFLDKNHHNHFYNITEFVCIQISKFKSGVFLVCCAQGEIRSVSRLVEIACIYTNITCSKLVSRGSYRILNWRVPEFGIF